MDSETKSRTSLRKSAIQPPKSSSFSAIHSFHTYTDSFEGSAQRTYDRQWEAKHGKLRDEWYGKLREAGLPISEVKDTFVAPIPEGFGDKGLTRELAKPSRWTHIGPDEMFQTGNLSLNHEKNRLIWGMFAEGKTEKEIESASELKNAHSKLHTLRQRFLVAKADGTFDWLDTLHMDWEGMATISVLRNDQNGMQNLERAFGWELPIPMLFRNKSSYTFKAQINGEKKIVETIRRVSSSTGSHFRDDCHSVDSFGVDLDDERRLLEKYGPHWVNCHSLSMYFRMSLERTRRLEANGAKQKASKSKASKETPPTYKPTTSTNSIV